MVIWLVKNSSYSCHYSLKKSHSRPEKLLSTSFPMNKSTVLNNGSKNNGINNGKYKPAFHQPQYQQCSSQTQSGHTLQETGLYWKQWGDMFSRKLHPQQSPASSGWLPFLLGNRTRFQKGIKGLLKIKVISSKKHFCWRGRVHLSRCRNQPWKTVILRHPFGGIPQNDRHLDYS